MFRHINPSTLERTALAPYNFVPLPNAVFTVAGGVDVAATSARPWEAQDRYLARAHSGWIDIRLTTKTPLFIRGLAFHPGENLEARQRPKPFSPDPSHDGPPAIPGSSLRGAIRTLVEILSFSKIRPVSRQRPFFRTVGKDRVGEAYRARMVRANVKPKGGLLRCDQERWSIEPRDVLRIPHEVLTSKTDFVKGDKPNYYPSEANRRLQYRECWVRRSATRPWECHDITLEEPVDTASWLPGLVVLTGSAPRKKGEFVFVGGAGAALVTIPAKTWARFLDDDQITNWQEKNWPAGARRKSAGHPLAGEPVFYLLDAAHATSENPAGLVFFGRAQMFRLPYDKSPADLVPPELSHARLDLAQALFGYVKDPDDAPLDDEEHEALGSRLRFDDAIAVRGGPPWTERRIVPQILSSPKPTAFSQYLTQDGVAPIEKLTTYLEGDATTLRGHKLYWHRWDDGQRLGAVEQPGTHGILPEHDTQSTVMEPVRAGVTFAGRVQFDNLADVELGALLEALQLPESCAHKIGMGKPLGLGSVRIDVESVTFIDRQARYAGWGQDGRRQDPALVQRCRNAFVEAMREHAHRSQETEVPEASGLRAIARLDALYHLLTWNPRPALAETRSMRIERGDRARFGDPNEFKKRPVLPTPHAVVGAAEPAWSGTPPVLAAQEPSGSGKDRPRSPAPAAAKATAPPAQAAAAVRAGDSVDCQVLAEQTKKGGPRFRVLANGKRGVLHPKSAVPGDLKAGETIRLVVATTGTEYTLRWTGPAAGKEGT